MMNLLVEDPCETFEERLWTLLDGLCLDEDELSSIGVDLGILKEERELFSGNRIRRSLVKKITEAIGINYSYLLKGAQPIFTKQRTASLYIFMLNIMEELELLDGEIGSVGSVLIKTSHRILVN